jgi:hypothetical protein
LRREKILEERFNAEDAESAEFAEEEKKRDWRGLADRRREWLRCSVRPEGRPYATE